MPPRSHMPHGQAKEHWDHPKAPLGNDCRKECCDRAKHDESARHKPKTRKETRPPARHAVVRNSALEHTVRKERNQKDPRKEEIDRYSGRPPDGEQPHEPKIFNVGRRSRSR